MATSSEVHSQKKLSPSQQTTEPLLLHPQIRKIKMNSGKPTCAVFPNSERQKKSEKINMIFTDYNSGMFHRAYQVVPSQILLNNDKRQIQRRDLSNREDSSCSNSNKRKSQTSSSPGTSQQHNSQGQSLFQGTSHKSRCQERLLTSSSCQGHRMVQSVVSSQDHHSWSWQRETTYDDVLKAVSANEEVRSVFAQTCALQSAVRATRQAEKVSISQTLSTSQISTLNTLTNLKNYRAGAKQCHDGSEDLKRVMMFFLVMLCFSYCLMVFS